MGDCRFCGQSAGILRKQHSACEEANQTARGAIRARAAEALRDSSHLETLPDDLRKQAARGFLNAQEVTDLLTASWAEAVDGMLEDGVLSPEEETRLGLFLRKLQLTQQSFSDSRSYWRVIQACVIRDLLEGKIPDRVDFSTAELPVRLDKEERIIWIFNGVNYYEDRTRTQYVGGSQGISFRVMKGVYYRLGAFRGEPVKTSQRVMVDSGPLVITTKHVTFLGPNKTFRVRHEKILAVHPLSDGVVVQRDAMTARPMIFETGDGWFIQNLLANLHALDER